MALIRAEGDTRFYVRSSKRHMIAWTACFRIFHDNTCMGLALASCKNTQRVKNGEN